jgi:hypothetical protein
MALLVENFFAGTNYLEELKSIPITDLYTRNYPGGVAFKNAPDSIFNKFSTFTYSKFIKGTEYDPGNHFIGYVNKSKNKGIGNDDELKKLEQNIDRLKKLSEAEPNQIVKNAFAQSVNDTLQMQKDIKRSAQNYFINNESVLANPTASNIIKWSADKSSASVVGFQPYSMTDFAFCKYYGKIPNNRLITLRRYPFPVDDQLAPVGRLQPIPVAQAVTWWGGDTANSLSSIGVQSWNLSWESITVTPEKVTGNELLVSDVTKLLNGIPGGTDLAKQLEIAYTAINGSDANLQQITKMEQRMQRYLSGLYETNGPYWNRVFGPVNVINSSTKRTRGMQTGWDKPFTLNFHYSFRSFNGLSPKVVALDLMSSFLNLTYNDAQFLGQLKRYFANPGLKFDPTTGELLADLLTSYAYSFQAGKSGDLAKFAETIANSVKALAGKAVATAKETLGGDLSKVKQGAATLAQTQIMTALADAIPEFISTRSALADRPVGEWHLVVGNPLNPIMVMGDLVCRNCTMTFDTEMGPDDFPTGVTFTVQLSQGKPRDKAAIERMFNLGLTKMMRSKIKNPSSAEDTFGETNNQNWEKLKTAVGGEQGFTEIGNDLGFSGTSGTFINYQNRLRKAYRYTTNSFDDGILKMYFNKGQEKQ